MRFRRDFSILLPDAHVTHSVSLYSQSIKSADVLPSIFSRQTCRHGSWLSDSAMPYDVEDRRFHRLHGHLLCHCTEMKCVK